MGASVSCLGNYRHQSRAIPYSWGPVVVWDAPYSRRRFFYGTTCRRYPQPGNGLTSATCEPQPRRLGSDWQVGRVVVREWLRFESQLQPQAKLNFPTCESQPGTMGLLVIETCKWHGNLHCVVMSRRMFLYLIFLLAC